MKRFAACWTMFSSPAKQEIMVNKRSTCSIDIEIPNKELLYQITILIILRQLLRALQGWTIALNIHLCYTFGCLNCHSSVSSLPNCRHNWRRTLSGCFERSMCCDMSCTWCGPLHLMKSFFKAPVKPRRFKYLVILLPSAAVRSILKNRPTFSWRLSAKSRIVLFECFKTWKLCKRQASYIPGNCCMYRTSRALSSFLVTTQQCNQSSNEMDVSFN